MHLTQIAVFLVFVLIQASVRRIHDQNALHVSKTIFLNKNSDIKFLFQIARVQSVPITDRWFRDNPDWTQPRACRAAVADDDEDVSL